MAERVASAWLAYGWATAFPKGTLLPSPDSPVKRLRAEASKIPAPSPLRPLAPPAKVSQTDAEAACVANGGNLASMHSDADHLVVMRACNDVSDTGNCWIGLNDADEEGTFVWTDGSALDYENWNAGEPNAWCALPPLACLLRLHVRLRSLSFYH